MHSCVFGRLNVLNSSLRGKDSKKLAAFRSLFNLWMGNTRNVSSRLSSFVEDNSFFDDEISHPATNYEDTSLALVCSHHHTFSIATFYRPPATTISYDSTSSSPDKEIKSRNRLGTPPRRGVEKPEGSSALQPTTEYDPGISKPVFDSVRNSFLVNLTASIIDT